MFLNPSTPNVLKKSEVPEMPTATDLGLLYVQRIAMSTRAYLEWKWNHQKTIAVIGFRFAVEKSAPNSLVDNSNTPCIIAAIKKWMVPALMSAKRSWQCWQCTGDADSPVNFSSLSSILRSKIIAVLYQGTASVSYN